MSEFWQKFETIDSHSGDSEPMNLNSFNKRTISSSADNVKKRKTTIEFVSSKQFVLAVKIENISSESRLLNKPERRHREIFYT